MINSEIITPVKNSIAAPRSLFFSLSLPLSSVSPIFCLSCSKTQPGTPRVCLLISLLLVLSLLVMARSFPLPGDRFWLCQTCKGPDLDTVWHPRISGPRDYSQQGEPLSLPLFILWIVNCVSFENKIFYIWTMLSTCYTKLKHITTLFLQGSF